MLKVAAVQQTHQPVREHVAARQTRSREFRRHLRHRVRGVRNERLLGARERTENILDVRQLAADPLRHAHRQVRPGEHHRWTSQQVGYMYYKRVQLMKAMCYQS